METLRTFLPLLPTGYGTVELSPSPCTFFRSLFFLVLPIYFPFCGVDLCPPLGCPRKRKPRLARASFKKPSRGEGVFFFRPFRLVKLPLYQRSSLLFGFDLLSFFFQTQFNLSFIPSKPAWLILIFPPLSPPRNNVLFFVRLSSASPFLPFRVALKFFTLDLDIILTVLSFLDLM